MLNQQTSLRWFSDTCGVSMQLHQIGGPAPGLTIVHWIVVVWDTDAADFFFRSGVTCLSLLTALCGWCHVWYLTGRLAYLYIFWCWPHSVLCWDPVFHKLEVCRPSWLGWPHLLVLTAGSSPFTQVDLYVGQVCCYVCQSLFCSAQTQGRVMLACCVCLGVWNVGTSAWVMGLPFSASLVCQDPEPRSDSKWLLPSC